MSRLKLAIIGGVLVASLVVGFALIDHRPPGGDSAWGCAPERIAFETVDGAPSGGSKTTLAAVSALAGFLAHEGTVSRQDLEKAFGIAEGPSSYDPQTGNLLIDGKLQAQFGVGELDDGTWVVSSISHCMRAPDLRGASQPRDVYPLPFPGATRTTLKVAEQTVTYPVILPADGTPGLGDVKTVWGVPRDPESQIEVVYDSGISLMLSPDVPPDPRTLFQALADDIGGAASVESVNGSPALAIVADWSTPCPNGQGGCGADERRNPGSVEVILDGVAATLYGHVSSDRLLAISSTLARASA